jgi:two-component system, NarL family, response regulator LiaR
MHSSSVRDCGPPCCFCDGALLGTGTPIAVKHVVAVSPHPLWLNALEQSLQQAGVEVVGKAVSGQEALALVEQLRPNVLVTDLDLPGDDLDGIALLEQARTSLPDLRAIVVSEHDDPQRIDAAFEAGAFAYVIKTARSEDFAFAVRQAFEHAVYIATHPPPVLPPSEPGDSPDLTRREGEILQLVAEGRSNADVARLLWVTEQTVKFHLANVYRKLGVKNRTQAARWAHEHGLLTTEEQDGVGAGTAPSAS